MTVGTLIAYITIMMRRKKIKEIKEMNISDLLQKLQIQSFNNNKKKRLLKYRAQLEMILIDIL